MNNKKNKVWILGPCALESREMFLQTAEVINNIMTESDEWYMKASFDKANRTSLSGQRGLGIEKTMQAFEKIKKTLSVPVITDIHEKVQCEEQ